jgi:hypothetical protein
MKWVCDFAAVPLIVCNKSVVVVVVIRFEAALWSWYWSWFLTSCAFFEAVVQTWCLVLGACCLLLAACCLLLAACRLVPGAWCLVPGNVTRLGFNTHLLGIAFKLRLALVVAEYGVSFAWCCNVAMVLGFGDSYVRKLITSADP